MSNTVKNIYYPPGGILIWLLMMLEIFTFLGAALVFVYYRKNNIEEFVEWSRRVDHHENELPKR